MTDASIASHFGLEVGTVRRLLNRWYARLPRSVVDDAVAKAINASAHSWNYIEVILKSQQPVQSTQSCVEVNDDYRSWAHHDQRNHESPVSRGFTGKRERRLRGVVADDRWDDVIDALRVDMSNGGDFEAMVVGAVGMRLNEYDMVIEVRNGFVKEWWRSRLMGQVRRTVASVYGKELRIELQTADGDSSSLSGDADRSRMRGGRNCAYCGEALDPGKKLGSQYCDDRCRVNAFNARKRGAR